MKINYKPRHYRRQVHLNTVTYNPPAVKTLGGRVNRALYGNDAPLLASLKSKAIQLIPDLEISDDEATDLCGRKGRHQPSRLVPPMFRRANSPLLLASENGVDWAVTVSAAEL